MSYYHGYKGKGMCNACGFSKTTYLSNKKYCLYYTAYCKVVARNCQGIKKLRQI